MKTPRRPQTTADRLLPGITHDVVKDAVFSECGRFRYRLSRRWEDGLLVNFLMLNPSTADASIDDPTIRRCMVFARSWGYAGIIVTNVYPHRSTDPRVMLKTPDRDGVTNAVGNRNHWHIKDAAEKSAFTVCAWGTHAEPHVVALTCDILRAVKPDGIRALRFTQHGCPSHPLYLPASCIPIPWRGA